MIPWYYPVLAFVLSVGPLCIFAWYVWKKSAKRSFKNLKKMMKPDIEEPGAEYDKDKKD